ncbi:hypothetical protein FQA39_LY12418 [Lamprigera yunnana]|nr:hypothetical protein FQA39_LY12418 [Lamprigera yunnana]
MKIYNGRLNRKVAGSPRLDGGELLIETELVEKQNLSEKIETQTELLKLIVKLAAKLDSKENNKHINMSQVQSQCVLSTFKGKGNVEEWLKFIEKECGRHKVTIDINHNNGCFKN